MTDWKLWACAQEVLRQHGKRAPIIVAERIGALALAGDVDGVATWKEIARRLDQLGDYRTARPKNPQRSREGVFPSLDHF